ncbi:MAG: prolyl oligopeptidase family serine peptidase [Microscillaceae bacterium]|jgi:dipeptidyl aminopeptidase/acylaminoacyl peptidase|nr:prolyl oligopeptidase family serine peptidase [Microscillaceae bacterium]
MQKIRLVLLYLLLGQSWGYAQFSLEQILDAPFPTELQASPVGNRVAWVFNIRGSRNIWLAEAPDFKPQQLTDYQGDNGQMLSSLCFSPDGNFLIYVRGDAPNAGGEFPNPANLQENVERAIYKIEIKNPKPQKLASGYYPKISPRGDFLAYLAGGQVWGLRLDSAQSPQKLFQLRGSQNALRWSPDGSKLAFVSARNDHSFIGIFDLKSKSIKFLDPSFDRDMMPVWSPDGKSLAFIRQPYSSNDILFLADRESLPWSIRVVEVASGQAREVWRAKAGRGSAFFLNGLVAENALFWTADNFLVFPYEGDGWHHLYSIPAQGGEARLLTPNEGEVEYAILAQDRKSIIYNANIDDIDRRHIWQVSASGGSPQTVTSGKGIEWMPAQMTDNQIVCLRSDATSPARPTLVQAKGQWKDFANELLPKTFPSGQLVEPQPIMITATDGMKVPAQLFLPKNAKPNQKNPAVIFLHGGSRRQMLLGFNYGEYYHKAYALNQYLASQGIVVLSLNFRSGIGYGMEFREAQHYGADGASEFNDVLGAGMYLQSRHDVNAQKIGLWGGSYGGYLTAMGLARASQMFACGVDIHGVHNWNSGIKNFVPAYDTWKRPDFAQRAFESSPLNFVNTWQSPVLLIHGDDDRNVNFSETVVLLEQLRMRGVHTEQLVLTDEVHSFLLHQNWLKVYQATSDFLLKFLKK